MSNLLPASAELLADAEKIQARIRELGRDLSARMTEGGPWLALGVLTGAFIFMADLLRHLSCAVEVDFIKISSYGDAVSSSGQVKLVHPPGTELKNRSILLIDDIIDTGNTLAWLVNYLHEKQAARVITCVFLDKPQCRMQAIAADYVGITVTSPAYVVGYGLDAAQKYRQLAGIYKISG
jgi:hypoxanthine phosphoribosyltransferase